MLYNKDWDTPLTAVGKALMAGADLIEKHGLAKFVRQDSNGKLCFLGALDMVEGYSEDDHSKASKALVAALGLTTLRDPRSAAADWNNKLERTAQEVVDAMRLAARTTAKAMA